MEYHWIYILELENGCYYTGYTGNLEQRYRLHLAGRASKYTRSFKPVRIARSWQFEADRGTAMKVEALIKKRGRKAKESLVANPEKLAALVLAATGLELRVTAVSAGPEAPPTPAWTAPGATAGNSPARKGTG